MQCCMYRCKGALLGSEMVFAFDLPPILFIVPAKWWKKPSYLLGDISFSSALRPYGGENLNDLAEQSRKNLVITGLGDS